MNFFEWLSSLFRKPEQPGVERPSSPQVWRDPDSQYYKDAQGRRRAHKEDLFIPFTEDPELAYTEVADTNSEDPLIDIGNHAEILRPINDADHNILCKWIAGQWYDSGGMLAALVIYRVADGGLIVHRVKSVTEDAEGRIWRYLGDNNVGILDPIYARDSNIWAIVSGTRN